MQQADLLLLNIGLSMLTSSQSQFTSSSPSLIDEKLLQAALLLRHGNSIQTFAFFTHYHNVLDPSSHFFGTRLYTQQP